MYVQWKCVWEGRLRWGQGGRGQEGGRWGRSTKACSSSSSVAPHPSQPQNSQGLACFSGSPLNFKMSCNQCGMNDAMLLLWILLWNEASPYFCKTKNFRQWVWRQPRTWRHGDRQGLWSLETEVALERDKGTRDKQGSWILKRILEPDNGTGDKQGTRSLTINLIDDKNKWSATKILVPREFICFHNLCWAPGPLSNSLAP